MKATLLVLAVLFAVPAFAQDAPTIEQCRANVAIWTGTANSYFDALSVQELRHRHYVLSQCGLVAANQHTGHMVSLSEAIEIGGWGDLQQLYSDHETARLRGYLERHGQLEQFNKEDAAGQR